MNEKNIFVNYFINKTLEKNEIYLQTITKIIKQSTGKLKLTTKTLETSENIELELRHFIWNLFELYFKFVRTLLRKFKLYFPVKTYEI